MEESVKTLICKLSIGRDGNEWVAIISYPTGKTTELRDAVFEEVVFAMARELDGVE